MATTLIHSVRLFDRNTTISQNGCIVLKNGLISNILLISPSPLPATTTIIDGTGHAALPGLIVAHDGELELKQALGFGVTTVLDMFNGPDQVQRLKELVKNRLDLADFRSASHAVTIEGGWPIPVVLATLDRKMYRRLRRLRGGQNWRAQTRQRPLWLPILKRALIILN
ncbi:uncharacterized protein PAC_12242 [Phialocephala subalpina]|uniref:Amidohydrolase-related domain-containing protein n=1 Tax=Phialocephala subalpina TaxID=576137 RepID=A0A1L7XBG1_9HELO|nr:uncharacterized protein PAC_12242 [Phialocephala subalpina]